MPKNSRRDRKNHSGGRAGNLPHDNMNERPAPKQRADRRPVQGQTDKQWDYINAINTSDIIVATGPAGTGKSYVGGWMAADAFGTGETKKLIVTRPCVEAGENLGFMPGELEEKVAPYLAPVAKILSKRLGGSAYEYAVDYGQIEPLPLAFMRGHTFDDCWVLFDEAQNATPAQMYLFLTRIGKRCKVIINGDLKQQDIPGRSGLSDMLDKLDGTLPGLTHIQFGVDDVVRSGIAGQIIKLYQGIGNDNELETFQEQFKFSAVAIGNDR